MTASHEAATSAIEPGQTMDDIRESVRSIGVTCREPAASEARAMRAVVEPESTGQIADLVRHCEERALRLAPFGAGRTLATIRPDPVEIGVSMARMASLLAYEPDDMTVVAEAGMTLGALQEHLATHRQHLPIDPPNPGSVTLGALVGAARSGPIRLSEGTPRDLLIGVTFIGHGGRAVHGGGRVVKNVAGYDLMKVMTGSFGTLGIVMEVVFRVRPLPERCRFIRIGADRVGKAFEIARTINNSISAVHLDVLSPGAANRAGCAGAMAGKFIVAVGIAGSRAETGYMTARIVKIAPAAEVIELASALRQYRALRDLGPAPDELAVQIAVPPFALERCLAESSADFRAHAGNGVAQLFLSGGGSADELRAAVERLRSAAIAARGHLRVISIPPKMQGAVDIFGTPEASVMTLMRRLKNVFDPAAIFNPGCFVGGL